MGVKGITDEGSAQRATHEGLKLRFQVTPFGASMHVIASYQTAAWPSAALNAGLRNGGEIFHTL